MSTRLGFRLRQVGYDLTSGMFFRPLLLVAAFGALAVGVTRVFGEASWGRWFFPSEPAAAQVVLGTIASSMMTVVSVVYSILLVALSLASMQFSTRVLRHLVRDRVSQVTLGVFVGTFLYCLLLLRVTSSSPEPHVPSAGVGGAILLALLAMGQLVYFIHHIVHIIQANYLVDEIATETEAVVDQVFAETKASRGVLPAGWESLPVHPVVATRSGYVQIIDEVTLDEVARELGGVVVAAMSMGHFATAELPIAFVSARAAPDGDQCERVRASFDLGPIRTMQDDVEWGVRQIVDIALKAISPAVNDPSTAATCIDHLGRLLVRAARRPHPTDVRGVSPDGVARVRVPVASLGDLVDLAFTQIRQYGKSDMAVSLRLMRVLLRLVAVCGDPRGQARIAHQARMVLAGAEPHFLPEDLESLRALATDVTEASESGLASHATRSKPTTTSATPAADAGS